MQIRSYSSWKDIKWPEEPTLLSSHLCLHSVVFWCKYIIQETSFTVHPSPSLLYVCAAVLDLIKIFVEGLTVCESRWCRLLPSSCLVISPNSKYSDKISENRSLSVISDEHPATHQWTQAGTINLSPLKSQPINEKVSYIFFSACK